MNNSKKIEIQKFLKWHELVAMIAILGVVTISAALVYQNGAKAMSSLNAPLPSELKIFCDKDGKTECDTAKLKEKLPFTVDDKDVKKKISSKSPNFNGLTVSVAVVIVNAKSSSTRTVIFDVIKGKCNQRGKRKKWLTAYNGSKHAALFKSKGLCSFIIVPDRPGVWAIAAAVYRRADKLFLTEPQKIQVNS